MISEQVSINSNFPVVVTEEMLEKFHLSQQRKSRLSAFDYAKKNNIGYFTFLFWRKKHQLNPRRGRINKFSKQGTKNMSQNEGIIHESHRNLISSSNVIKSDALNILNKQIKEEDLIASSNDTPRGNRIYLENERKYHVQCQATSGLNAPAYAKKHGIPYTTFNAWQHKYANEALTINPEDEPMSTETLQPQSFVPSNVPNESNEKVAENDSLAATTFLAQSQPVATIKKYKNDVVVAMDLYSEETLKMAMSEMFNI